MPDIRIVIGESFLKTLQKRLSEIFIIRHELKELLKKKTRLLIFIFESNYFTLQTRVTCAWS